uniref:RNase H type-1 domain-containing protein n=1 Tax=Timema cristinae TaxID=61476 RepID=A0A7R9GR61_TIMCR|nr:unnamed protein product [Timema cristinae]
MSSVLAISNRLAFCWIPGHAGPSENELVNQAAKEASLGVMAMFGMGSDASCTSSGFQPLIRTSCSPSGTVCRGGPLLYEGLDERRGDPPPVCELCDAPLSVYHILVECRKYAPIRLALNFKASCNVVISEPGSWEMHLWLARVVFQWEGEVLARTPGQSVLSLERLCLTYMKEKQQTQHTDAIGRQACKYYLKQFKEL